MLFSFFLLMMLQNIIALFPSIVYCLLHPRKAFNSLLRSCSTALFNGVNDIMEPFVLKTDTCLPPQSAFIRKRIQIRNFEKFQRLSLRKLERMEECRLLRKLRAIEYKATLNERIFQVALALSPVLPARTSVMKSFLSRLLNSIRSSFYKLFPCTRSFFYRGRVIKNVCIKKRFTSLNSNRFKNKELLHNERIALESLRFERESMSPVNPEMLLQKTQRALNSPVIPSTSALRHSRRQQHQIRRDPLLKSDNRSLTTQYPDNDTLTDSTSMSINLPLIALGASQSSSTCSSVCFDSDEEEFFEIITDEEGEEHLLSWRASDCHVKAINCDKTTIQIAPITPSCSERAIKLSEISFDCSSFDASTRVSRVSPSSTECRKRKLVDDGMNERMWRHSKEFARSLQLSLLERQQENFNKTADCVNCRRVDGGCFHCFNNPSREIYGVIQSSGEEMEVIDGKSFNGVIQVTGVAFHELDRRRRVLPRSTQVICFDPASGVLQKCKLRIPLKTTLNDYRRNNKSFIPKRIPGELSPIKSSVVIKDSRCVDSRAVITRRHYSSLKRRIA